MRARVARGEGGVGSPLPTTEKQTKTEGGQAAFVKRPLSAVRNDAAPARIASVVEVSATNSLVTCKAQNPANGMYGTLSTPIHAHL